jgi:prepilin-type processing-associated H-X9-DG protein
MPNPDALDCPRISEWKYDDGSVVKSYTQSPIGRAHIGDYDYNAQQVGVFPKEFFGREWTYSAKIQNPANLIIIADSSPGLWAGVYAAWSSTLWFGNRRKNITQYNVGITHQTNEGVKPAHGVKMHNSNILWADGHASAKNYRPLNFDNDYNEYWYPDPP